MAKYIIDGNTLTDIANAIREKKGVTGTTATIECQEFATEIRNLSVGGGDTGGGYAATAYIEYHDGSIFNGGPGLSTVPFVAGVTKWSDISSIASEGAEDVPLSGGPYNCVYVYLHAVNWHLLNVSPDDLVQAKTYYAIGA